MPNVGLRTTYQSSQESRLVREVSPKIEMIDPEVAPLITITLKVKNRLVTNSPQYEHIEDDLVPRWGQNGTATVANNTGSTTITVVDGTIFTGGDTAVIPKVASNGSAPEFIRIVSVSGNVLTVIRDVGGAGVDTIPANAPIRLAGKAYEENSSLPSPKYTSPTIKTNYTQIFRTATQFSRTAIVTKNYGAPSGEREREHAKKLKEHKEQINAALYWGRASENLTGGPSGNPIRTTGGLRQAISTNVLDAGSILTRKKLDEFARLCFRYGSKTKILAGAPILTGAISNWGNSFLTLQPGDNKTFGMQVTKVITNYGTFLMVTDWMLENGISGQPGFNGVGFCVDLDNISYRPLKDSDTKVEMDIKKDGVDGKSDQIITEAGFEIKLEKTHGFIYNISDWME